MAALDGIESEFFFEEQISFLVVRHIADFGCARSARDGVWDSQNADTVLILAEY